jgi:hypothetical protein
MQTLNLQQQGSLEAPARARKGCGIKQGKTTRPTNPPPHTQPTHLLLQRGIQRPLLGIAAASKLGSKLLQLLQRRGGGGPRPLLLTPIGATRCCCCCCVCRLAAAAGACTGAAGAAPGTSLWSCCCCGCCCCWWEALLIQPAVLVVGGEVEVAVALGILPNRRMAEQVRLAVCCCFRLASAAPPAAEAQRL